MSSPAPEAPSSPAQASGQRGIRRACSVVYGIFRHPATTLVLLVLALCFFLAWKLEVVPFATAWGDLGTWVAAIFTGGGLVFAGISAKSAAHSVAAQTEQRRDQEQARRQDEEDKRTAMAHSVAISSWWANDGDGTWFVCFRIANKSPYPISRVTVRVWDLVSNKEDSWASQAYDAALEDEGHDVFLDRVVGTMLPDDELAEAIAVMHPMAGPRPIIPVDPAAVVFTDVWGKNWIRTESGTTEAEHPACMCQSCQESVPPERIRTIEAPSPHRPQEIRPLMQLF